MAKVTDLILVKERLMKVSGRCLVVVTKSRRANSGRYTTGRVQYMVGRKVAN